MSKEIKQIITDNKNYTIIQATNGILLTNHIWDATVQLSNPETGKLSKKRIWQDKDSMHKSVAQKLYEHYEHSDEFKCLAN